MAATSTRVLDRGDLDSGSGRSISHRRSKVSLVITSVKSAGAVNRPASAHERPTKSDNFRLIASIQGRPLNLS
jgi:hypothetical protein